MFRGDTRRTSWPHGSGDLLGLSAGDTLAVTGGAGLVASYAIPLAKRLGLRVVADAKPPRDGGAVVDVRAWDLESAERGIEVMRLDAAIDRTDWLESCGSSRPTAGSSCARSAFAPEPATEAYNLMGAGGLRGRAVIVF
jgi:NADPH2:quinone reductase